MLNILRYLIWDKSHKPGRYAILQSMLKDIPGLAGIEVRRKFYRKYFGRMGKGVVIHQDFRVRNIHLLSVGDRVNLGESCFIQAAGGVEIGDNVIVGPGVKIWSQNHEFKNPCQPVQDQGYTFSKVVIGNDVWIAANAFIMPGAQIGDGAIVSAGAVVGGKPIAPYKIIAGNPARVIGSRIIEAQKVVV